MSSNYQTLQRHYGPQKRVTIRQFSQLTGRLVAIQPGVEYAPLYYKPLEKIKDHELKIHQGNYNSFMNISGSIHPIIDWWIHTSSYKLFSHGRPKLTLYSDAPKTGWGAFNETDNIRTGGVWSASEQTMHIKLKACQLCLKTFCKNITHIHVRNIHGQYHQLFLY